LLLGALAIIRYEFSVHVMLRCTGVREPLLWTVITYVLPVKPKIS
jgi:hypothetical protein